MHDDSDIKRATAEYEALTIVMQGLKSCDHDLPDALLERQSLLIGRLSLANASSGYELAGKAAVLRDLVVADDMVGVLTVSLCRDVERLFPITPALSAGYLRNHQPLSATVSALSFDDLMKLARLFTN